MSKLSNQQRLEAAARKAPKKRGAIPVSVPRRIPLASHSERERLINRIKSDETLIRQCRGLDTDGDGEIALGPTQSFAAFNVSGVEARLKRNKMMLQRLDPANHKFQGAERARADKRLRELAEKMRKQMLSTFEMGYFPKKDNAARDSDYRRACDKSFKQEVGSPQFQEWAQEYKHLARRLDPDNPELANIEHLRPKRRY